MGNKLKNTLEIFWQDEKDFFEVLSLLGLKDTLATLRRGAPTEVYEQNLTGPAELRENKDIVLPTAA